MANSPFDKWVASSNWIDTFAKPIQKFVGGVYGVLGPVGRGLKDLAHGSKPLGHPLHPALTDIPMGAWLVAVVLDWAARHSSISPAAGTVALLVGTIVALFAVLTGYTDFHETYGLEMRNAFLHGITMTVVYALQVVSLLMRLDGTVPKTAVVLSTVAVVLVMVGGYIGGHLVFGHGTMVNRTAFEDGPGKFVAVGTSAQFEEGTTTKVDAKGRPVLVTRTGGTLCAIANTCSHAGGPLDEGKLDGKRVTCPWHGSVFDVCTGKVVHGPATFAQPQFAVREVDGNVEVKLESPSH